MPPTTKKISAPKKVSKKVVKKVSKTAIKTVAPVVVAPVEVVPTETVAPDTHSVSNYAEEFTHLLGQLRSLQTTLKELTLYTVKLEKRVSRDQKVVQKRVNGKRKRVGNSSPSGFSKPGPVSDELRTFLTMGPEDLIARTEVTKRINTYCKENGLQDQKDTEMAPYT